MTIILQADGMMVDPEMARAYGPIAAMFLGIIMLNLPKVAVRLRERWEAKLDADEARSMQDREDLREAQALVVATQQATIDDLRRELELCRRESRKQDEQEEL